MTRRKSLTRAGREGLAAARRKRPRSDEKIKSLR